MKRAFLERVLGWRASITSRFEAAYSRVSTDVCIFLGTNAAALAIALVLATRGRGTLPHALWMSVIITLSVALMSLLYTDSNWLYKFLRSDFAVLAYPTGLLAFTAFLLLQFHGSTRRIETRSV